MNFIPQKEDLIPITNDKSTFYDCGFNKEFDDLDFKTKLQVLCDVVRESIYPNPTPNPKNDIETMNGNCYTASFIMKKYLEDLNIGNNIKVFFARCRKFDPKDISTIHMVVLVENNNRLYQVDTAPYAGYKMGSVDDITNNPIYEEYVEVTEEMIYYLNIFREIIYQDSINNFNIKQLNYYLRICKEALKINILNGYNANTLRVLVKYFDNNYEKDEFMKLIKKLKPYSKINKDNFMKAKKLAYIQIKKWEDELEELKRSNADYKRQLELAINIIQEKKMFDSSYEEWVNINGVLVRRSFMNPRFMLENNLNQIMIKPSAKYIEVDNIIRDGYIESSKLVAEYEIDLSKPTKLTGIKPMIFSHTLGEEYIRSMMGTTDVLLLDIDADKAYDIKKKYRESLCPEMWYKEIMWVDHEPILWHPFVTNLVHSTDNACEASLHFQIGYPEHQSMTRFMYPNPKLVKKK